MHMIVTADPARAASSTGKTSKTAKTGTETLQKVAQQMARLNIGGLPRNYELFHEALCGHTPELGRDLMALGHQPSQQALDDIGLRYRLVGHCGLAADTAQGDTTQILQALSQQLAQGLAHKQVFLRALEAIGSSLREEAGGGFADLSGELDFLSASAADLMTSEAEMARNLKDGLSRLDTSDRKVAAARTMVLRDRLTGLPNRIAFSRKLEQLFGSETELGGTALMIVDIDQFSEINQQYGQWAGNRLMKRLAAIFRKSIKKNDFVARIGGDEFAFLFADVSGAAITAIAERLRASVENGLTFATSDGSSQDALTISVGVTMAGDAGSPQQAQSRAEMALATARRSRRPIVAYSADLARQAA